MTTARSSFLPLLGFGLGLGLVLAATGGGRPAVAAVDCDNAVEAADLMTCAKQDMATAEKRVADLERRTVAALRPDGRDVFIKVQEAWKTWRDAECAWVAYDIDTGKNDSLILATCRADMTLTRADELEATLETVH